MKKNIKKFLTITALSTLFFTNSVYGYEKKEISVNIDNMLQPITSNIINKNGYTLISFRDLFEMLNAKVDYNDVKKTITAKKDDKTIIINLNNKKVTLNDKDLNMPVDIEIIDGTTFVPLRPICDAFNMKIDWDSDTQKINIDTDKQYIFLNDIYTENNEKTLSKEDAIKMAQQKNSNIKNLKDTIEYSKKLSTSLNDQLIGQNLYAPGAESILRNLSSIDGQIKDSEINEKIINDTIELSVISSVANIKTTKLNIALLEKTININEKNIQSLELKHQYGLVSENQLKQAQDEQKTNKINLDALKNSLKIQQQTLNNILGQSEDVQINIPLNDDFSALDKIDLESYIIRNKEGDISIQLLKNNLTRLEESKKLYTNSATEEELLKAENDIKSAERKLADAKINMEEKLRSSYNNLLKIKDNDKSLKIELDKSIDSYNNIVTNYINGNATLNQIEQAKLAILNIEKQIEQNKINFSVSLYTFNKPYLISDSFSQ